MKNDLSERNALFFEGETTVTERNVDDIVCIFIGVCITYLNEKILLVVVGHLLHNLYGIFFNLVSVEEGLICVIGEK